MKINVLCQENVIFYMWHTMFYYETNVFKENLHH